MYFLSGNDKMSRLIREKNWDEVGLGEPKSWPQQLKTACSIMLNSRFPMIIWWGKELLFLYNDAYISTLGIKHPEVLGKPGKMVWSEIWEEIGPLLIGVQQTGVATWSENQRLFLERSGYPEETYHTFSYSPIYNETGQVAGVFTAVQETTASVLTERQLSFLKDFSQEITDNTSTDEMFNNALEVIRNNPLDFPFAALYSQVGNEIKYVEGTHNLSSLSFDEIISLDTYQKDKEIEIHHLPASIITKLTSVIGEKPSSSIILFIFNNPTTSDKILITIGLSLYRKLDELYFNLFEQMADLIKINLIKINEFEAERKKQKHSPKSIDQKQLFLPISAMSSEPH